MPSGPSDSCPILCLPPRIRNRIYREAGLIFGYNVILPRFQPEVVSDTWHNRVKFQMSLSLLLTCKTFYLEASAIIYSENRFYLHATTAADLKSLQQLQPTSIAHLNHLAIGLDDKSCISKLGHGYPTILWDHQLQRPQTLGKLHKDQSLVLEANFIFLLVHWQVAVQHIMKHITSNQLNLYLTCDIDNSVIASTVVQPLARGVTLASCSIRLNKYHNPVLRQIAEDVALKATQKYHRVDCSTAFHYLKLPLELRYKILEYTDLITPLKQVTWNHEIGFRLIHEKWLCSQYILSLDRCCQFRNCTKYSDKGCYCRRYHSAYTSCCRCWAPPVPLFLVCKVIREDAETVFFRNNRVTIMPAGGVIVPPKIRPTQSDVSIFLRTQPRALPHLRDLEIVFPLFNDNLTVSKSVYEDWKDAVQCMHQSCNLSNLKLKVFMQDRTRYQPPQMKDGVMNTAMTDRMAKTHVGLLRPLKILTGCKRIFFHITHPQFWSLLFIRPLPPGMHPYLDDMPARPYVPMDQEWEDKLGWTIFGEEYHRLKQGKEEEESYSEWFRDYKSSWFGWIDGR